jgi:hypothetical protein
MIESFFLLFLIFVQLLLIGVIIIMASMAWQSIFGVPWVRTPRRLTKEMLSFAGLKKGQCVVDFGSGDGSIVIDAARDFGASGIGIEARRDLTLVAKLRAKYFGVSDKTEFVSGNFFSMDLPKADIIAVYLFPEVNVKLEPLLVKTYPSGTPIISRDFSFPNLPLKAKKQFEKSTFFLYYIP